MKKFNTFIRIVLSLVLVTLLVVSTATVSLAKTIDDTDTSAYTAHFNLIGAPNGDNWSSTDKTMPINKSYGQDSKYYIELNLTKDSYFALNNGSSRYAPSTDGTAINKDTAGMQGTYNENNAWHYTGETGKVWICVDQSSSEWYPYVWIESKQVTPPPTPSGEKKRVYFTNNQSWSKVNIFSWDNATDYKWTKEWPGDSMTFSHKNDQNQDIYYYDLPVEADRMIFNDGSSQQTVDISEQIEDNRGFYPVDNSSGKWTVGSWAPVIKPVATETYKLFINDKEVSDITSGTATCELKAEETTVVIKKYSAEKALVATYYLSSQPTSDEFSNLALSTNDAQIKYTPAVSLYKFTFDASALKLSAAKATLKRFFFQDNTSDNWIGNEDADMYITNDNGLTFTLMTESVDERVGLKTWYADIVEPANNSSISFLRANRLFRYDDWKELKTHKLSLTTDTDYNYNKWQATYQTSGYSDTFATYVATDNAVGVWNTSKALIPTGTITDYTWGIYCDTVGNGDVKDCIKLYTSSPITTKSKPTEYRLFLPSYVDEQHLHIYTTLDGCSVKGGKYTVNTTIAKNQDNDISLNTTDSYSITSTNASFTLKVFKTTSTSAMLMTTSEDLYAKTTKNLKPTNGEIKDWASAYKEAITDKGDYKFFDEKGEQLNSKTALKKIKGRGNSSWEASMELYGKYAYNITLKDKAKLIDGATSSKKYCLLANNMDESAVRNTLIYAIGEDANVLYSPKTRLIDLFDNGNYLGSYIIVEKVEYGSGTMISEGTKADKDGSKEIVSMDSYNEDTATAEGSLIDYDNLVKKTANFTSSSGKTYKYQYNAYYDSNSVDIYDAALVGEDPQHPAFKDCDYVMEFELEERYQNEASWIEAPNGQHVCMKYPEFASKSEMEWFVSQFSEMYDPIYDGNGVYSKFSQVIDVDSFAKTYIIQELAQNLDSAATSYYITGGPHFDKMVAAPLWDYDWAVGDYYKTKQTTTSEVPMDNPEQWFVKNKSIRAGEKDVASQSTPCFEAQLCKNSEFALACKFQWTNVFVDVLNKYIDNPYLSGSNTNYTPKKLLLTSIMPSFKSAQEMNEHRWHQMSNLYNDAAGTEGYEGKSSSEWGTKCTSTYKPKSFVFNVGNKFASTSESWANISFENTVYYLNDWIATRWNFMSGSLWDNNQKCEFSDVSFSGTVRGNTLTISNIYVNKKTVGTQTISNEDINIEIYKNGEFVKVINLQTYYTGNIIPLDDGVDNDIYLRAYYIKHPDISAISETKTFNTGDGTKVFFKFINKQDYVPYVTINDGEVKELTYSKTIATIDDVEYAWFEIGGFSTLGTVKLEFEDGEKIFGSINVDLSMAKDGCIYIGCDDLNSEGEVVNITNDVMAQQFIGNTYHMISNNIDDEHSFDAHIVIDGESYVLGNTINSGTEKISISDATDIQKYLANLNIYTDLQKTLADFNLDGAVSIADATALQKRLANLS